MEGSNIIGIKAIVFTSRAAQVYKGTLAESVTNVDKAKDQNNKYWISNIYLDGGVEPPNLS